MTNPVQDTGNKMNESSTRNQSSSTTTTNQSTIARFYEGKNVLVTGGSGFLGKVLLWKLYESCPGIGKIYVLLRTKKDACAHKRLVQMLKAKPFDMGTFDHASLLNKMIAIDSDITSEGLGLSQTDRSLLLDQVNVVFHCAASVRFDAPLKDNMRDNFLGTQEIIKLCNEMAHLNALIHVSTAYSNCHIKFIPEAAVPLKLDLDAATTMINSLPDSVSESTTSKLLEGRPNTYTYSKALAEHLVAQNEGKYPIGIVRPSIVVSSLNEPCPGWVDNVNGLSGLGSLASIGLLRQIDWNYYAKSDVVPVDYVANCMICSAYDVCVKSTNKIRYYNMTSGSINPVTWGGLFDKLRATATLTPPTKIVRPMIHSPKYHKANPVSFALTKYLSELLFAYMVDLLLVLMGYKKIILKITKKMHKGYEILKPFTSDEWEFEVRNVVNLCDSLDYNDKQTFNFDMRYINWDELIINIWMGVRRFILKEEPTEESYKSGLTRQKLVNIIHYTGLTIMTLGSFALTAYACVGTYR